MTTKYFIKKLSYYNEFGEIDKTHYRICYKTKFLFFFSVWKYVKHIDCGFGDCYNVITEFETIDRAKAHIKNVLCKKIKTESWYEETVDVLDCNDIN